MSYRPWQIHTRHRNPTPSHALRAATRKSFAKSNPYALQAIFQDPGPMQMFPYSPHQPTEQCTDSTWNTTPTTFTDTLYCTIDTSKMADNENEKPSAGPIRTAVETEIRTMENYTNWQCRAVTVDPKNTSRIRIACRDEADHQLVKKVAETKVGAGARVLRDELYPIKVDSVKVAWLSRKENSKAYGSMVVYLTKGSDAWRLLADGFFHAGGESGVTSTFENRPRPMQCYNCQEIGHKAFQCKNAQKCAKCAAEGHHHSTCDQTIPKCIPCGGPHESYSKNCRKLYPSHHE
ncbi:hypothetical protein ASPFODRAFT_54489 [Aspergillus luchuensis CBS 106.47]|uniref:CCHC-type domain-containing protein n=1 Tax=Aspergillus luchuensis (strain CBS 106.47) TaxID=1137211 RepID=A0A1M3SZ97_ASPLC|nr:hypothetical protein ASPFODRAFT_54489 [Aspergillus luchuensis CBS 106.47]